MSPAPARFSGLAFLVVALNACDGSGSSLEPPPPPPAGLYRDATAGNVPDAISNASCMDAEPVDIDQDGDLDLVLAMEFRRNVLLLNDGSARFSEPAQGSFAAVAHDSEDVEIADFTGDGLPDVIFVSEDDRVNEYYVNLGGADFQSRALPVEGTSNGVTAADLTGDGAPELVIANSGDNFLLVNDGAGGWINDSANRIPGSSRVSQDVELADVDGDGDLDLVFANETAEQMLINTGNGFFTDETAGRLPALDNETREVDLGDVDGDGDLDIVLGNVIQERSNLSSAADVLLLNDGNGVFTVSDGYSNGSNSYDVDLVDLDGDGDLDIVTANANLLTDATSHYRAFLNDGDGRFTSATTEVFGARPLGNGFDVATGDFDGDGRTDLYLCSRGGPGGGRQDYLFLRD